MNPRSTTTGVEVGFSSTIDSPSPLDVVPPGKYHCDEVLLWQGAWVHPNCPSNAWLTATPPPSTVTVSASQ